MLPSLSCRLLDKVPLTKNEIYPMLSHRTGGGHMATNPVDNFWGSTNQDSGSVPPVEPADLRSVWEMQTRIQALRPGEQIGIGADSYKQACGPGADVRAVFERASNLSILQDVGVLALWLKNGVPDDAVFHVAAKMPMNRRQTRDVYQTSLFDVDEFIKQVEERIQS
jgi:hypothetical protein